MRTPDLWEAELPSGEVIGPVLGKAELKRQVRDYVNMQRMPNGTEVYRVEETPEAPEFTGPYSINVIYQQFGETYQVVDSEGAVRATATTEEDAIERRDRFNDE